MFYGIAKQSTTKCVLNENNECALSYLGRGAMGYVQLIVILSLIRIMAELLFLLAITSFLAYRFDFSALVKATWWSFSRTFFTRFFTNNSSAAFRYCHRYETVRFDVFGSSLTPQSHYVKASCESVYRVLNKIFGTPCILVNKLSIKKISLTGPIIGTI